MEKRTPWLGFIARVLGYSAFGLLVAGVVGAMSGWNLSTVKSVVVGALLGACAAVILDEVSQ